MCGFVPDATYLTQLSYPLSLSYLMKRSGLHHSVCKFPSHCLWLQHTKAVCTVDVLACQGSKPFWIICVGWPLLFSARGHFPQQQHLYNQLAVDVQSVGHPKT